MKHEKTDIYKTNFLLNSNILFRTLLVGKTIDTVLTTVRKKNSLWKMNSVRHLLSLGKFMVCDVCTVSGIHFSNRFRMLGARWENVSRFPCGRQFVPPAQ